MAYIEEESIYTEHITAMDDNNLFNTSYINTINKGLADRTKYLNENLINSSQGSSNSGKFVKVNSSGVAEIFDTKMIFDEDGNIGYNIS